MNSNMSLPSRVTIELTNRCNRACPECPRHKMAYPLGDMTPHLYTTILAQLPTTTTIVPFFRGESLLHPSFGKLIRMLRGYRDVQLATNGDLITPTTLAAIADACTFLSVSLHTFQLPRETRLPSLFHRLRGHDVETQVSIVDTVLPSGGRHEFVAKWRRVVDRVRIYTTHSVDGFGSMGLPTPVDPCNKPFEDMVVFWDGRVGLCNHDWNGATPLGDVTTQSVADVWNGRLYRAVRALHRRGCRAQVPSCVACDFTPRHVYGEVILNG